MQELSVSFQCLAEDVPFLMSKSADHPVHKVNGASFIGRGCQDFQWLGRPVLNVAA
jgi:hypothetical protein